MISKSVSRLSVQSNRTSEIRNNCGRAKSVGIIVRWCEKEGLDVLLYRRFCDKISKGTSHVEPRTLPPTSAAAMYHVQPSSVLSCNALERKR